MRMLDRVATGAEVELAMRLMSIREAVEVAVISSGGLDMCSACSGDYENDDTNDLEVSPANPIATGPVDQVDGSGSTPAPAPAITTLRITWDLSEDDWRRIKLGLRLTAFDAERPMIESLIGRARVVDTER